MKRILLILAGLALAAPAAEKPQAVLHKKDGRAWLVSLEGRQGDAFIVRLEKSEANTRTEISTVERLDIKYPPYDAAFIRQRFDEADYAAVAAALEPAAAPVADYMAVSNNLQEAFTLLMKAWYYQGETAKARVAAARLLESSDPSLRLQAQVFGILAALAENDLSAAETALPQISNPAAQLYARACLERAQKQPKAAIQTAVELIAEYSDDRDWLSLTELLCVQLYLDLGMTDSAAATARQISRLYPGTHIAKQAQALNLNSNPEFGQTE